MASVNVRTSRFFVPGGKFGRISDYSGSRVFTGGSLFSGISPLRLHHGDHGRAYVGRATLGRLVVGAVGSTGHDVTVREARSVSLILPTNGTMTTEVNGRTLRATKGQGLLLPRGRRETRVECESNAYSAYVVMLQADDLSSERHIDQQGGIVLDGQRSRDAEHALRTVSLLTDLLENDARVLDRDGAASSWFDLLTSSLDQCVEEALGPAASPSVTPTEARRYVALAEEFMRWNLADIATTMDIAAHVGISRRTLENAFQKVRGESPARILSGMRLQAARRLLLSPDGPSSVTDVCLDCGIGHHGRFSAAYRAEFGETPSDTLHRR